VRIQYSSTSRRNWRSGGDWATDYPDSDYNFSYRLQQMTSLKVDPQGRVLQLTDKSLFEYPWIYIIEPGQLEFTEEEVLALRKYLLNGGFLMVDDFWGEREWDNFYHEMKRVFPDREPKDLPDDHPIFHNVFELKNPRRLQVPSIHAWYGSGRSYERQGSDEVHIRGYFDDHGRMMAVVCHNTDLGDGWEREGENEEYFKTFSEPIAYPLGINIVFYAMTH
jgi:hypothetical protein